MTRLLVIGSQIYDRPDRVRWILDWHQKRRGPLTVLEDGHGMVSAEARAYAEAKGWPVERIWLKTVMAENPPDYVASFGDGDPAVIQEARRLSITVGEVP